MLCMGSTPVCPVWNQSTIVKGKQLVLKMCDNINQIIGNWQIDFLANKQLFLIINESGKILNTECIMHK